MIHRYRTRILAISTALLFAQLTMAQSNYTFHSKNVAVIGYDKFPGCHENRITDGYIITVLFFVTELPPARPFMMRL